MSSKAVSPSRYLQGEDKVSGDIAVVSVPLPEGLLETLEQLYHPKFQKKELGNHLYPIVSEVYPAEAGKLTGMLLERDVSILLRWLTYPAELSFALKQALQVLNGDGSIETTSQEKSICHDKVEQTFKNHSMNSNSNTLTQRVVDSNCLVNSASLCIRNLHPAHTEHSLHDIFHHMSSIRVCRDFGCAFVHFSNADDAWSALIEVGDEFGIFQGDIILESDYL